MGRKKERQDIRVAWNSIIDKAHLELGILLLLPPEC
jgi:hypothetical protein